MSHVVSISVEIRDLQALQKACQRLGWTFRQGQQTYQWFGRWMDDSPIPAHLFTPERTAALQAMPREERIAAMNEFLGHCNHAIAIPGCHYEVGLKHYGDHYKLVWDFWEGQMNQAMGTGGGPLLQAYAVEKAKLEAQRQGLPCTESILEDGTIKLQLVEA
ncbi:MAG: DUF1257 domain-containing protein [Planctomycetia bacterium]|nr:DUF1257 domain-containing protein [Planctomycetia bacterium]